MRLREWKQRIGQRGNGLDKCVQNTGMDGRKCM